MCPFPQRTLSQPTLSKTLFTLNPFHPFCNPFHAQSTISTVSHVQNESFLYSQRFRCFPRSFPQSTIPPCLLSFPQSTISTFNHFHAFHNPNHNKLFPQSTQLIISTVNPFYSEPCLLIPQFFSQSTLPPFL